MNDGASDAVMTRAAPRAVRPWCFPTSSHLQCSTRNTVRRDTDAIFPEQAAKIREERAREERWSDERYGRSTVSQDSESDVLREA